MLYHTVAWDLCSGSPWNLYIYDSLDEYNLYGKGHGNDLEQLKAQ